MTVLATFRFALFPWRGAN